MGFPAERTTVDPYDLKRIMPSEGQFFSGYACSPFEGIIDGEKKDRDKEI